MDDQAVSIAYIIHKVISPIALISSHKIVLSANCILANITGMSFGGHLVILIL